jgi:hypothetical protein
MSINNFLNQTISFKSIIVICVFWGIIGIITFYQFFGGLKEGFEAGLFGLGSIINYKMGDGVKNSWDSNNIFKPQDSIINDINNNNVDSLDVYKDLEHNESGPIPLPDDELVFFDTNKFSPDCCPSNYTNSSGCLCAAPEQMKYLSERAGNSTLVSNY